MFKEKYDRLFLEAFEHLNQTDEKDRVIAHEVVEGVMILQFYERLAQKIVETVIKNKRP